MMSNGCPERKSSSTKEIPSQRAPLNSDSSLSSTPGGTLYSTTPGGTRIIYERAFLMQMRNSPVARTPPTNFPFIPGVTLTSPQPAEIKPKGTSAVANGPTEKLENDDSMFPMDD